MREYLDSYKGIDSMIEFPVPKFMCNNRNYLILIATLKSTKKGQFYACMPMFYETK